MSVDLVVCGAIIKDENMIHKVINSVMPYKDIFQKKYILKITKNLVWQDFE